jgi:hypothetical protein
MPVFIIISLALVVENSLFSLILLFHRAKKMASYYAELHIAGRAIPRQKKKQVVLPILTIDRVSFKPIKISAGNCG